MNAGKSRTRHPHRISPDLGRVESGVSYRLAAGATIRSFDSGQPFLSHQIVLGKKRLALNAAAADLLNFLSESRGVEDISVKCQVSGLRVPGGSTLLQYLESPPLRTFVEADPPKAGNEFARSPSTYMAFQLDILPARVTGLVSSCFGFMFKAPAAIIVLGMIIISQVYLVLHLHHSHPRVYMSGPDLLVAWIALYLALLFHEIGHCAACRRFGQSVGPIGLGLYLCFPVLYADISRAWELPRRARLIANIAGIYFHLAISALCVGASVFCHRQVMTVISVSIAASTVLNLNPLGRFDGYWILADLLGIPDLSRASNEAWRNVLTRFTGRGQSSMTSLNRLTRRQQLCVAWYAVGSIISTFALAVILVWHIRAQVTTMPARTMAACHSFQVSGNHWLWAENTILPVCCGGLALYTSFKVLLRWARLSKPYASSILARYYR